MRRIKKIICFLIIIFNILSINKFCNAAEINISAPVCVLMEYSTGKILFEKNLNKMMYPASTTKLMTAILVLEKCQLTDVATVSNSAVDSVPAGYSTAYLQKGEKLTIEQLLHVLLIPSANDAANVLAEHVGSSIANFANMMNSKAKEIGCENTNFKNPSGIHDENHYSTAYDLSLIAKHAMQFQTIKDIVQKTVYNLPKTDKYNSDNRIFYNTNLLLSHHSPDDYYYPYATGLKTGYTNPAKDCIIATAKKDDLELIAVILGAEDTNGSLVPKFLDCKKLFEYGFSNYSYKNIKKANSVVTKVSVLGATEDTKNLNILVKNDINVFLENNFDINNLEPKLELDTPLVAPIKGGSTIGKITYDIDGIIYTSELIAETDVNIVNFVLIIFRLGLILLVIFIFFAIFRRS
ncbi:MAG: D-alanyl-D-alanine carboxypeptidase family protein [Clostridia bacterium]|nr:D-alanyl-D-alanine carboxypeptidase family protein [Clostridia bacterium]